MVSCGEYGKNLGELSMTQKADGRWEMTSYEIVPVTTDIDQDAETQNAIDQFMDTCLLYTSTIITLEHLHTTM